MTTLINPIDIACADRPDPFRTPEVAIPEALPDTFGLRCSRFATHDLVCELAGLHGGLYRDSDGAWWTGDWTIRLATPDQSARWQLLSEISQRLGFEV